LVPRHLRHSALAIVGLTALAAAVITTLLIAGPGRVNSTSGLQLDAHGLPLGSVSYEFIRARWEGQLTYPGSTMFSPFGGGESHQPGAGEQAAFVGGILLTTASADEVYSWYKATLTARGWTYAGTAPSGSGEVSAQGLVRGVREVFVVGIDDPRLLKDVIGRTPPPGLTVYEYSYTIWPSPSLGGPSNPS
jgi:hypothetical protein